MRITDKDIANKLISDKLSEANWESHLDKSDSLFVNARTWGLMLTGKFISLADETERGFYPRFHGRFD